MTRNIITFLSLAAVWLLWSGNLAPLLLRFGFISVLLVMWISYRMDRISGVPRVYKLGLRPLLYAPWLIKEIIISNLQIARIILSPKPAISPAMVRVRASQTTDLGKVVYANSITFTPGTITVDLRGDMILVHALTDEMAENLKTGEMNRRVARLEGDTDV